MPHCVGSFLHQSGKTYFPAYGKECRVCDKHNHFAKMCRSHTSASIQPERRATTTTPRDVHRERPTSRHHNVRQVLDDDSPRNIAEDDDSSSEHEFSVWYTFIIDAEKKLTQPKMTVSINNVPVSFIIDFGASVNLISASTLATIMLRPTLSKSTIKLFACGVAIENTDRHSG